MRSDGIYSALTSSVFLHALILVATLYAIKHSPVKKIQPYIVSLVGDAVTVSQPSAGGKTEEAKTPEAVAEQPVVQEKPAHTKKPLTDNRLQDRISELQAKKKIERLSALRKIIDVGGQKGEAKTSSQKKSGADTSAAGQAGKAAGRGDYYSMVQGRIRQQWIFPESIDKDLETVIMIRIAKDGSVTIMGIEQKSGNPLFDRSVLRAINNASPFPAPPEEMEIGVRFRP